MKKTKKCCSCQPIKIHKGFKLNNKMMIKLVNMIEFGT